MEGESDRIGFMQGRLSPIRNNRIQSFPWDNWQIEFLEARELGFKLIEWTIDEENFDANPLVDSSFWKVIADLSNSNGIKIPSVTCDYFKENPPWVTDPNQVRTNVLRIMSGMTAINSQILVIPLVDQCSIPDSKTELSVIKFMESVARDLEESKIQIAFESSYGPLEMKNFISKLDPKLFGVNYDMGDSAFNGHNPDEEMDAFGDRILNVHIKDRPFGLTTVPLGEGSVDFSTVFKRLKRLKYGGNLILQCARSKNENHAEPLLKYRQMTLSWLESAKAPA